ncbi:unnamed protein product [Mytilus edulis]|uniref:Endonuclease/exonuclease/phosphatase domain-containing protein n=1 Tax=Mytilus edulis TaxID=6550 RepID=A0A8S3SEV8_MYTED|nr:unnamed protein product [Mytilus edulis]
MSPRTVTSLKMCFLNLGGLMNKEGNKTDDPLFLNKIDKYDLAFFAETHIGYESNIHRIGPFNCYNVCRPKTRANNRFFGGLAVLVKKNIKPYVKILKNTCTDIMWIKLEKDFFGFQKDLYMCVVYNPPSMSSYTQGLDRDITECLEQETAKYMKMGNVLLCGDFNARIANSPDYILNDDQSYLPLFDNYPIDKQILKRQSSDTTIDSRGKSLLDLCILNQLRILNGRVLGDVFGKYTCYTPNGSSVVDYVMVSESILDQILYFYVHNFMPTISDCHCILEWEMSSKFTVDDNDCNINMFDKSPNFIWSDESPTNFQTALLLPDIQTQIDTFNKSIIKESQSSVDEAAAELSHIFLSAATNSLKRNKLRNKKIKTKKWFDGDLYHLRNKLISYGKIYSKFPYDPLVRGHYYKLNKQYSKLRKFKYKEYKKSLVEQLQNLHDDNPKSYWKLINDLKNNDNKDHSSAVAPSVWVSHFNGLYQLHESFKERVAKLEKKLDNLEKNVCFNNLDKLITEKEISFAISKLRCNKSPGLDNISNNMIKHSQNPEIKYQSNSVRKSTIIDIQKHIDVD